jgi:hypothetical protein
MSAVHPRPISGVLALLGLLAALVLLPTSTLAHGGGTPQVTDLAAGPYHLFVWTSPEPWRADELAHVTVAVTRIDDSGETYPVPDAQITVHLIPDAEPAQVLTLHATPVSAVATGFYETDHLLPNGGLWRVEVDVTGADGAASASFTMSAQAASTNNWPVWAGGALALLAVGLFVGMRRPGGSARKRIQGATETVVAQE